ncbi:Proteophosphoglycan 5 [Rhodotorula diobovata]|uniref:Proteophosphoglycan 5 n=1 Tax=Rhodotorula diobovata TaxID=5288 RepID=A0A5C5G7X6_9BASI|nr:Proteophosphoglycan 5 [Rhodotorula diobovata]
MASVGAISDAPDTAADPPSSPPRDAARNLPYELLHSIFLYASTSPSAPHTSRPPHGGAVRSWHSYERAAPLSLVCRRWRPAAQAVLFSSVALVGHEQARRFVDALAGSERARQLAAKETAWVVLALVPADETSPSSSSGDEGDARAEPGRQRAASELLVSALEACSSAAHVHIRTLHHAVRARLLATLMNPGRPLVTMVLGPRNLAAKRWSERLWEVGDGWDLRPSVENLEHTGLIAPWSGMGAPPRAPHVLPPLFPTLALRRVKLWHDWPIEILVAALRSSPHLESVDFYFEQWKPTLALVDAFKVPAKSLREVRYLYNPTSTEPDGGDPSSSLSPPPTPRHSSRNGSSSPSSSGRHPSTRRPAPLFDLLLPHLTSLRTLHCSSTELSASALYTLPPSLRLLSLKTLNSRSRFSPREVTAVLRDDRLVLPDGFTRLVVTDSPDEEDGGWGDEAREEVRLCCEERGVTFEFRMDFEDEGIEEDSE